MVGRMESHESVPYFVLRLDGSDQTSFGRVKALFTVPEELAEALSVHPILCRGSSFALEMDIAAPSSNKTTFLSTIFESRYPEETAQEISQRLAARIDYVGNFKIGGLEDIWGDNH